MGNVYSMINEIRARWALVYNVKGQIEPLFILNAKIHDYGGFLSMAMDPEY